MPAPLRNNHSLMRANNHKSMQENNLRAFLRHQSFYLRQFRLSTGFP